MPPIPQTQPGNINNEVTEMIRGAERGPGNTQTPPDSTPPIETDTYVADTIRNASRGSDTTLNSGMTNTGTNENESGAKSTGHGFRKVVTFGLDSYWAYRLGRWALSTDANRTIIPINKAAVKGGSKTISDWFIKTNLGKTKAGGVIGKALSMVGLKGFGRVVSKALPGIGGGLALLDVGLDWTNYLRMDNASDAIVNALANNNKISAAQLIEVRKLAEQGLNKPENARALTEYLEEIGLNKDDIDTLVKAGKAQEEACSDALTGAVINTTCTGAGAVIGGLLGCGVFSVPGALVGAAVGNLVGMAVNGIRKIGFSGISNFFKGFFS